jgi:phage terminase large subunit-like protein
LQVGGGVPESGGSVGRDPACGPEYLQDAGGHHDETGGSDDLAGYEDEADPAGPLYDEGGGDGGPEGDGVEALERVETRGERNCRWIEEHCRIPEGKFVGQPVKLRPFQRDAILRIYDNPAGTRRAILSYGRKNAKTTLAGFILLLHTVGPEARPNSQLFSAAQSREQAAILFALAAKMVRLSPTLRQYVVVRDTAKQLHCGELGTLYRALSAEASTAYGLSPVLSIHDELGQVKGPRSELYEALETAAGAQEEPLSIIISTQAPNAGDLLSVLIDDAKTGADPKTVLILHTAPEDIDPFSDEAIKAANPAYGDFLNPEEVRGQAEDARRMPAREAAYRNLILNQRVNMHSPYIARSVWESCAGAVDDEAFATKPVYAGLDLSARNDLTALVMIAQDDEGRWNVRPEFWCPEVGLSDRARRDRVPYDVWVRDGHIHATPGASVDLSFVAQRLAEIGSELQLRIIGFDRWRMDYLTAELNKLGLQYTVLQKVEVPPEGMPDGLVLVKHGQGFQDMPPALDGLEAELLNGRLRHGGHPVLTWCAANAVAERNAAGERKLEKAKSTGRIDGLVALAMAMRVALTYAEPAEDYAMGRLITL